MKFSPSSKPATYSSFFTSVIADMLASKNVEQLLKIFLTSVGEKLNVDRVAIGRAIAPQQVKVLVEAITPDCETFKDHIYPIQYFGADTLANFPCDRVITFTDTAQVTETLLIHQQWHLTHVRAMISAPIVFDFPDPDSQSHIWGLAIVQYHLPRQWQTQEITGFWEITQALSECLQYWSLLMRPLEARSPQPPTPPQSNQIDRFDSNLVAMPNSSKPVESNDADELQCTRVILAKMPEDIITPDLAKEIATEIAIIDSFGVTEEQESTIDNNAIAAHSDTSIDPDSMLNQAVSRAMQQLEQYFDERSDIINGEQGGDLKNGIDAEGIDVETKTEEDILENITQLRYGSAESRAEYLQQKVSILIADLQQKAYEIVILRSQVKQLVKAQSEFRQILDSLQSEDLSQTTKDAVTAIYQALQSE